MGKYVKRVSVQLNSEVAARINAWCLAHDRTLTWAINYMTSKGLDAEGWPPANSTQTDNPTGMEP